MIKPFASAGLLGKIVWHPPTMKHEELHKFIPKSCLPKCYGGDLGTVEELHQKHRRFMLSKNEYFIMEEKQANLELDS
jgi:hypothetical protein